MKKDEEKDKKKPSLIKKIVGVITKRTKRTFGVFYGEQDAFEVDKKELHNTLKEYMGMVKDMQRDKTVESGETAEEYTAYLYDFYAGVANRAGMSRINPFMPNQWEATMTTAGTGNEQPMPTQMPHIELGPDGALVFDGPGNGTAGGPVKAIKPIKLKVTPKEVRGELELPLNMVSVELLDEKIKLVKAKLNLIKSNHYSEQELTAMIERLENRKKFNGDIESFFSKLKPTTDEKIEELLGKYDLVMHPSDIYVPDLPEEAIDIMTKYKEHCNTLCNKKPIFYIIATSDYFKVKQAERDPILLAQSPFGFFWYILGAWDKELIFLTEL